MQHDLRLDRLKTIRKRITTAENTYKRSFYITLSNNSILNPLGKKNNWVCNYISHKYNTSHSLTCPRIWGTGPTWLKLFKIDHFPQVWALFLTDQDHKAKQKQLDTLLKSWEKWTKPVTHLKMIIFHKFEHSSMPIKIAKKNCYHSYHSMPMQCKSPLDLPKNWRE